MNRSITFIGYLGRNLEVRDTTTRTVEIEHFNPVAETTDTREYQTRSREYGVFSLATHTGHGDHRTTTWNRCILFNVDRMEYRPLRIARPGARIEVTGRWESYTFTDEQGVTHTLRQLVVQSLRVLQHKPAASGNPDEPFLLPRRKAAA
jgi:single-stranded DNA-binding protein